MTPPDKGFVIAYQPGAKDASGRIADYTAVARETKPVGPDVTSIFTNQSGLIRYRYDGPHGKGGVYIYFPALYPFTELLRCLRNAANGPTRFITEHSDELVADPEEMVSRCLGPDLHPSNRAFTRLGYEFHYVIRTGNAGSLIGFTIESRPDPYGVAGIRSYYAVATFDESPPRYTLNVYATPEDRPATPDDPLAQAQEVGLFGVGPATTRNSSKQ